ncbi:hypothetical protein BLA24_04955 [Streptomyces cinnamoneus]|uniref:DUF4185 domain-containing protein n=1 Tax=Streptomyces cinnamoneus TaxID=53446 RepID=A0A2G1XNU9_STRCJ|nr:DUF5005 domain-containing protein [Streptomyces cinnamoneus]PHQ52908.1 hypothetical protein BLA24_04955 [Streptomyces cinnamoneus]PPT11432.1 hypothetical protein CYQ11_28575 [Streptomyces cinnamoneus]
MRIPRVLVALAVAVCAFVPPGDRPAAGPPGVGRVRPATALDEAWGAYAERPGRSHWTGGDSTYSVATAAGELWVFSDTFLGTVRADGSRPPVAGAGGTTPFVHNSFVLWPAAGRPRTVTGRDRSGGPAPVVSGPSRDQWYWARAGVAEGRGAAIVYARYARTGSGPLDVAWQGNVLARFGPGRPDRPRSLTPLPSSARTAWGAWLERQGGHTYVYGTEQGPLGAHYLRLARVAGSDLRRPWQYWTADGKWSARESRSARLTGADGAALRTSDELSVVRHGRWYALVTQRSDEPFSAQVQLAWSRTPHGPFTRPRTVYTAPEAGPSGTYRNRNVIAYNPHEHPELERPGELVVSYNVNSLVPQDVIDRAGVYRPRFLRVTLGPPGG